MNAGGREGRRVTVETARDPLPTRKTPIARAVADAPRDRNREPGASSGHGGG